MNGRYICWQRNWFMGAPMHPLYSIWILRTGRGLSIEKTKPSYNRRATMTRTHLSERRKPKAAPSRSWPIGTPNWAAVHQCCRCPSTNNGDTKYYRLLRPTSNYCFWNNQTTSPKLQMLDRDASAAQRAIWRREKGCPPLGRYVAAYRSRPPHIFLRIGGARWLGEQGRCIFRSLHHVSVLVQVDSLPLDGRGGFCSCSHVCLFLFKFGIVLIHPFYSVSGRLRREVFHTVGPFTNSLILRSHVHDQLTFEELYKATNQMLQEALRNQVCATTQNILSWVTNTNDDESRALLSRRLLVSWTDLEAERTCH